MAKNVFIWKLETGAQKFAKVGSEDWKHDVKVFRCPKDMAEFTQYKSIVDDSKLPHVAIADGGAVVDDGNDWVDTYNILKLVKASRAKAEQWPEFRRHIVNIMVNQNPSPR